MSLTTDCCFRCAGKRPIELKAKAIAFQNSEEGKAAARNKRQKKAESKKWKEGEWIDYNQDRQDRMDRGSVVSSHFNDYSIVGSEADVANLNDFRDFQEESSATIPEAKAQASPAPVGAIPDGMIRTNGPAATVSTDMYKTGPPEPR